MRIQKLVAVICIALFCFVMVRADEPLAAAQPEGRVTLLGSLEEWKYPDSKMPQGVTMSGNGPYPAWQFVTCRTVLTTPDSMDKVVDFYSKKFGIADKADKSEERSKGGEAQAVFVQDDSKDRPVGVRVFAVNRAKTSTTLVISRAEGEKQTHIAWMHYIRIGDGR